MRLIFFDMDGVLTPKPHPIQLAEMVEKEDEFYGIHKKLLSGIGEHAGLDWIVKEMVRVFADTPETTLKNVGKRLPAIKGAAETIRELKKCGYHPILVTNGFDQIAGVFARRLGITEWYGNSLEIKDGRTTGCLHSSPLMTLQSKGNLVRKIVTQRSSKRESVAVGNDVNDWTMFQEVGLSILLDLSCDSEERLARYLNKREKGFKKKLVDFFESVDVIIEEPDLRMLIPYLIPEPAAFREVRTDERIHPKMRNSPISRL